MHRRVVALLVGTLAAVPAIVHAHGMRTAYLELTEGATGDVLATLRTTFPDAGVVPLFPEGCTQSPVEATPERNLRSYSVRCAGGLAGRRLAIDGLGPVLSEAVVRLTRPDGTVVSQVLTADAPGWVVPVADSWIAVGRQYVRLGIDHILEGRDHLLFLLALVLYVRRPRAVIATETAFTISHSLSFSATALGWIHVSAAAAEACIALSLILVALDAAEGQPVDVAAWQGPLIALVFGLVHGLGFAGALSEVGLPDRAVASALVGFGVGVEIGQILFLVVVMLALWALRRLTPQAVPGVVLAGSYLVGVVGSYWLFERLWICFS